MHPLAKEAVENSDLAMCRRIVMIFLQLGNDYILPMIDNSNELKDQLLNVGKGVNELFIFLSFSMVGVVSIYHIIIKLIIII